MPIRVPGLISAALWTPTNVVHGPIGRVTSVCSSLKVIEVAEIETTVAGKATELARSTVEGGVGAEVGAPSSALQMAVSARSETIRRVGFFI